MSLAALLLGLVLACHRPAPPSPHPTPTAQWRSQDGWRGELRHYRAEGPPVVLVHGMGVDHHNFDLREDLGLAQALQRAGWDVWIPALRGDPATIPPEGTDRSAVDFDAMVTQDVPAFLQRVRERTGREQVAWVGHSLGGILLYAALAAGEETISAGVAVASPASLQQPTGSTRRARLLAPLAGRRGLLPARSLARLSLVLGRSNPTLRTLANPDNIDIELARLATRQAIEPLPRALLAQGLQWLRSGEISRRDGSSWLDPGATATVQTPLLVIAADADRVVSQPDVAEACVRFPVCELRTTGPQAGTTSFGHVDVLLSQAGAAQVHPWILDFLQEHARPHTR